MNLIKIITIITAIYCSFGLLAVFGYQKIGETQFAQLQKNLENRRDVKDDTLNKLNDEIIRLIQKHDQGAWSGRFWKMPVSAGSEKIRGFDVQKNDLAKVLEQLTLIDKDFGKSLSENFETILPLEKSKNAAAVDTLVEDLKAIQARIRIAQKNREEAAVKVTDEIIAKREAAEKEIAKKKAQSMFTKIEKPGARELAKDLVEFEHWVYWYSRGHNNPDQKERLEQERKRVIDSAIKYGDPKLADFIKTLNPEDPNAHRPLIEHRKELGFPSISRPRS